MTISKDQALGLYRSILGRDPESDAVLRMTMSSESFASARDAMLSSPEFRRQIIPPPVYRPRPAAKPIKHPMLCGCAIMKNEAPLIEGMLLSVLPVADFVLLHDTGSTDKTPEIARDLLKNLGIGFQISNAAFVDFANSRNTLIDSVPSHIDWILMMDCDEQLVPEDHQLLIDLLKVDCLGWRLPRYNFVDAERHAPPIHYPDFQARLFRHDPRNPVRYAGAVHEVPRSAGAFRVAPTNTITMNGDAGGPHIHHLGHVVRNAIEIDAKIALYNRLARGVNEPV